MPRKGRSNEEIVHALHQVEGGEKVTEVCRRLGVSEQTFYRWKKQFAGLGLSGAARAAVAPPRKQQVETGRRGPHARSAHPAGDCPKKAVKPRARCTLAEWAQTVYRLSQRRAARLIPVHNETLRYRHRRAIRQDALAAAAARAGGGPRALRLSTIDGVVETGRLARQCQTDLSALWPRGPRGADEAAEEARQPRARAAAGGRRGRMSGGVWTSSARGWPTAAGFGR